MRIAYDREVDSAYVYISEAPVARTVVIDDVRMLDLDVMGSVRGVELLSVSHGVRVSDLPVPLQTIAPDLLASGIPVADGYAVTLPSMQSAIHAESSLALSSAGATPGPEQWTLSVGSPASQPEVFDSPTYSVVSKTNNVLLPEETNARLAESAA
jgi:uncharacterized protein YuzE